MNFQKLTDYLDYLVHDKNTPCVDCIVCKDHKMIYRHMAGKSDIEKDKNVSSNDIYIIYSMSKMLTCTAALQLYEKGKYALENPISKYLPEFSKMKVNQESADAEGHEEVYAKNSITVLDLFTMRAGLDYVLGAEGIKDALKNKKTSTRDLVDAMSKTILGFEPGTRYRYSLCHDVLGALIEIWSGQKLSEYMQENIFEPLGMKNTFFGVPNEGEKLSRMVTRYAFDENRNVQRLPLECKFILSPEYQSGGAGICSCTEDYAIFLDALSCGGVAKNGHRILTEETVKLMGTDHLSGQSSVDFDKMRPGYGYGLGVRVHKDKEKSGSLSPIGEFGWDGAAGCFSMVDTENKLSLTYFQQIHAWDPSWDLKTQTELRNALYLAINK